MISFPFDSVITGKDPETGLPILDRAQLSYQFQNFIASVFSSGIVPDITNCLKVSSAGGMRIRVAPGIVMCGGAIGIEPAEKIVTIPPADPKLATVYTVVCRKDNSKAKRNLEIVVHKGIPAVKPVPKVLERTTEIDNQNSVYEICLAEVTVPAGATSLSVSNIRDTRYIDKLCGISSAYSQVKTTEIYEQFRVQFEEWFDKIKGQLSTDAAGNLQNQISGMKDSLQKLQNDFSKLPAEIKVKILEKRILPTPDPERYGYVTFELPKGAILAEIPEQTSTEKNALSRVETWIQEGRRDIVRYHAPVWEQYEGAINIRLIVFYKEG